MIRNIALGVMAGGLLLGGWNPAQAQGNGGQTSSAGTGQSGSGRNGNSSSMGGLPPSTSTTPNSAGNPTMPGLGNLGNEEPATNPRSLADMERMRNSERQRKLVADTDRLLALATQLKADMDKTNKDMLSLDVIRKADEIEKLAKTVKDRMKGS